MGSPGRKTKYTPECVKAITDALALGMTRRDACVHGDISEDTFAVWLANRADFAEAVKKAEMVSKMSRLARITKAGKEGTWQADAWVLERKYPDEFGQKLTLRIDPEDMKVLRKHGLTPAEAWAGLMQELARADAD